MTEDQYAALVQQHVQLLELSHELLTALVALSVIQLVSLLLITGLAAWSVQRVSHNHQVEFRMILELLAKVLPRESANGEPHPL